jgi:hypothetical protein
MPENTILEIHQTIRRSVEPYLFLSWEFVSIRGAFLPAGKGNPRNHTKRLEITLDYVFV